MAYCTTNCTDETLESKLMRKKDREIELLKDVIADQAKRLLDAKISYEEAVERNQELRDTITQLRLEVNDMCVKESEIKDLLSLAKECADDTAEKQEQKDIIKIRVETLQEVVNILNREE